MELSIVITTKNRIKDLFSCIESIKNSEYKENFELIIIDDVSNDGTEKLTPIDFGLPDTKIYHFQEPLMMVKARNFGAKKALGKYILFIDDDNIISYDMITELVKVASKYPELGIVGPSMYYANDEKYMDYQTISLNTGKTNGHVSTEKKEYFETDGVPNLFLIKKEVFEKCGYFDELLIQTFTEPDFSFYIKKYGYKSVIVPKAKTIHNVLRESNFTPRALGGQFKQKAYCLMRNRAVIVKRYGSFFQKLLFIIFFSWVWPTVYSLQMIKFKRFDLVKIYWFGWFDGLVYFFSNKMKNSLPKLIE